ncbi:MAG: PP0621 family protein [Campylobacterota bacterium]
MLKLVFTVLVLVAIYYIFFKKPKQKKQNSELEDMVECSSCGVFTSSSEAIEKDGKFYCSKECLK